ncbi:hypothetical protein BESB_074980 [Besnoitia besnoiti]|uniref:Uncharacterized protein n=1 Tax=Besnoitia besnoiti TaxID=94643 RepID=A0A2A9MEH9_BESBE|nr:uncharacterized protein BESB_074980 [Besnoitia besnoiti]PFH34346.1 hypothetical protein BESB_074980 [Besnoitia besnoiti]
MFHRRPNAGAGGAAALDERMLDAAEQRAQCVRFCATMFLVLSTLFIIRVQQERYEQSAKHHYRVAYKFPWEQGSFLKEEHSQLQLVYLHPAFQILPSFVESLDDVSLLTQPLGRRGGGKAAASPGRRFSLKSAARANATTAAGGASAAADFSGDDIDSQWLTRHDLATNWLLSFFKSVPEDDERGPAEAPGGGHAAAADSTASPPSGGASGLQARGGPASAGGPDGTGGDSDVWETLNADPSAGGSIVGMVMDSRLFRRVRLPGCSSTSAAMFADHCFIALVRFPLRFCFDPAVGLSPSSAQSPGDASWTAPGATTETGDADARPRGDPNLALPFFDISWTCGAPPAVVAGGAVGVDASAGEDEEAEGSPAAASSSPHPHQQYCVHVVSGLSMGSIQKYVRRVSESVLARSPGSAGRGDDPTASGVGVSASTRAHERTGDDDGDTTRDAHGPGRAKGRKDKKEREAAEGGGDEAHARALRDVGTVAYFCGSPMYQLLALDTANSRLFFAQPIPLRRRSAGAAGGGGAVRRRLAPDAERYRAAGSREREADPEEAATEEASRAAPSSPSERREGRDDRGPAVGENGGSSPSLFFSPPRGGARTPVGEEGTHPEARLVFAQDALPTRGRAAARWPAEGGERAASESEEGEASSPRSPSLPPSPSPRHLGEADGGRAASPVSSAPHDRRAETPHTAVGGSLERREHAHAPSIRGGAAPFASSHAFATSYSPGARDASLCIASVSLEDNVRDVTECREVRNEVSLNLDSGASAREDTIAHEAWRGVWLHYDVRNSSLVLFSFDRQREQDLVLTSMNADTMQLKFSLRLRDFRSGWFLSSEDSSSGKILLIGDRPPYLDSLQSIDVESGYREHADLHHPTTLYAGGPR